MARCSVFQSSASTQPHPYRLATPPLRRSGSPINVVARGHRFQLTLAERNFGTARPVSPEILTEPESSPLRPGRHLHRTYTIGNIGPIPATAAEPTPQLAVPLSSPVLQPLTHDASTAISDSPRDESRNDTQALSIGPENEDEDEAETPITGIHIGSGIFRLVSFRAFPIQAFEAPMSFSDFVALRGALDSPYRGLTWIEFQIMVGECTGCNRIMLMRSKDHHRCRGKNAPPQLVSQGQLFGLLDSTAGGQGVTHKQYLQTFASCVLCQRIFTRTAAVRHRGCHGLDSESEAELESEEE